MNTHTAMIDMLQDVSKIREEAGRQNKVCDMHALHRFSIRANHPIGSRQVSNLDYRDIPV